MRAELAARAHARLRERIAREGRPSAYLLVDIARQQLQLCRDGQTLSRYPVSTGANGVGGADGSYQTPPGLHQIAAKIGAGAAPGLCFRARLAQPKCAKIETRPLATGEDTITSRILRLDGLEPGVNRGDGCDSFARYIYLHGTAEEGLLGRPVSHGCVRLANAAVIEVFERVELGALVWLG